MTTIELLHDLTTRGVVLSADGDRLAVDGPDSALTDELLAAIKACKADLLELLKVERCPICGALAQEQSVKYYRHIWCSTPGHFDGWHALGGRKLKETDAPIVRSGAKLKT